MDLEDISTEIPYGRRPKLSPTTDIVAFLEKAKNLLVTKHWEEQLLMNIACIFDQIHSQDSFQNSDPWQEFVTLIKSKVKDCKDVPTTDNGAFLEKVMNLLVSYWQKQLSDFPVEQQLDHPNVRLFNMVHHVMIVSRMFHDLPLVQHLSDSEHNQLCRLFNMFHHVMIKININIKTKLDAALKGLEEIYYYSETDSGGGVPVRIRLVNNNNGDASSSVKRSPPGKGSAGGFVNASGDAAGSMNAPLREGDLEMGSVNNNGDPPAPGDVPSSIVPHAAHTADRSGWGLKVAMTGFSAAASRTPTTSMFAMPPTVLGVVCNMFAILLADTNRKATNILAKIGILACAVGVLADMGKDLPLPLFMVAMTVAIAIIIVTMVFAKRLP